jgi:hypothetical protein
LGEPVGTPVCHRVKIDPVCRFIDPLILPVDCGLSGFLGQNGGSYVTHHNIVIAEKTK